MMNLTTLTVCMCHLTGTGGFVYYLAWMLKHSDHSEMATASAFFTLLGAATVLVTIIVSFFAGSILPVVLLAVLVLATIALTMQGLPRQRNEYMQVAEDL